MVFHPYAKHLKWLCWAYLTWAYKSIKYFALIQNRYYNKTSSNEAIYILLGKN